MSFFNTFRTKIKKSSGDYFKLATQHKKNKEWDEAIDCLRNAYEKATQEGVTFGANQYLRLPKYLFMAGKTDEAWREYNVYLTNGFTEVTTSKDIIFIDHSAIYGAMAAQLKKEKKFFDAEVFIAVSSLAWQKGMLAQKRKSELEIDSVLSSIAPSLKKAGKSEANKEFQIIVREYITKPESKECSSLIRELEQLK